MQLLKVRLEMAKFLQETISESGFPGSDHEKAAQEFADFFRKVCALMKILAVLFIRVL